MSTKQYLKMADMFELPVNDDDRKAAVDLFSHMVTTPYSVDYTVTMSKYAAHAINSHDELVTENERLRDEIAVALGEKQSTVIIPEGWQLVPMEPTEAMISEVIDAGTFDEDAVAYFWDSMLAAAPKLGD